MIDLSKDNTPAPTSWDAEVFLLGAAYRDDLVERAQVLLAQSSGQDLAQLAVESFCAGDYHYQHRLAIVAKDSSDLSAKLNTALEKLIDGAEQIRDVSGIYYTASPAGIDESGQATKVGFLFPGEGSQYQGMFADLAELFPNVKAILDHCDQLHDNAEDVDEPYVTRFFRQRAGLSQAQLDEREEELRRLDNAMFAAIVADWVMMSMLEHLHVQQDTIAGHSGGELFALMAAGALSGSDERYQMLGESFRALGRFAPEGAVDSRMLALGMSAKKAQKLIDGAMEDCGRELAAHVAMLNCPHQTVVVGAKADIEIVEAWIVKKGKFCQPLDLEQPYHTELFEPYMVVLRDMFEKMDFSPAQVPTYSCTTGELFPQDADSIRELTLAHWERPVRFIELIENQYRDGVRCFIEVGPRNHLSAFVDDILRGKPDVLVMPANTERSGGLEQLLHLVAQLHVHHFGVDPTYLYGVRGLLQVPDQSDQSYPTDLSNRDAVMLAHQHTMAEFLALQQSVMQQYVAQQHGHTVLPVPEPELIAEPAPAAYPMIDEILELAPQQSIVARRRMTLEEDYFSAQHTVGGRELSRVDPEQYGLPVVPMTFSIEMFSEVAQTLVPGWLVTGMCDIKLYKWLDYEDGGEAFAQVEAEVDYEASDSEKVVVKAQLFHWWGSQERNPERPACTATIELAVAYPEAPVAPEYAPINCRPISVSRERLYKNLFHGEEFHGVGEFGRFGDDGVESTMTVLPRERLFTSNPDPQFIFDPVLLDVSLHPMCAWHLEQEDQSGRILLPIGVDRIDFYGPRPDVGAGFYTRAYISKETTRQVAHEVQIVDANERMWCQMHGCQYWRFYLPFREYNFFGPKDIYMLSLEWDEVSPQPESLAVLLDVPNDLRNPSMQPIGARVSLSEREYSEFTKLEGTAERRTQWMFGRQAIKDAARTLYYRMTGQRNFMADIEVDHDEHGRPRAYLRAGDTPEDFPYVSLSHCGTRMLAMASTTETVGVDIEKIAPREDSFLKIAFSAAELESLKVIDPDSAEWITRYWCAKEAIGKALGQGLIDGPRGVEIVQANPETGEVVARLANAMLREFPAYRDKGIKVQTDIEGKHAVATTIAETQVLATAGVV